jgi:hypothetical protein
MVEARSSVDRRGHLVSSASGARQPADEEIRRAS